MRRLVDWHTRLGRLGLRLLWLHLLWCAWTLRGGILLGAFPATAAVHAVLRSDERHRLGDPEVELELRGVRAQFRAYFRQEFAAANRLGLTLAAVWALLLVDRSLVSQLDLGGLGPVLAGAHTVAGVVLVVLTAIIWVLQAQFAEGTAALLRRSLVLLAGRPAAAALTAASIGLLLYAYYLVPGFIPVFGIPALAAAATACLWRTGILTAPPIPATERDPQLRVHRAPSAAPAPRPS